MGDQARNDFERWARPLMNLDRDDLRNGYRQFGTQCAWEAWQEAWLHLRKQSEQMARENHEMAIQLREYQADPMAPVRRGLADAMSRLAARIFGGRRD